MPDLTQEQRKQLLQSALDARSLSYSPYSKFRVGASILLKDGQMIQGANVENASYGGCICAERTALLKAHTNLASANNASEDQSQSPLMGFIKAIAVASDLPDSPCSPCGICRQFIREFAQLDTPIFMVWKEWDSAVSTPTSAAGYEARGQNCHEEKGVAVRSLEELLPLSFGPDKLLGRS